MSVELGTNEPIYELSYTDIPDMYIMSIWLLYVYKYKTYTVRLHEINRDQMWLLCKSQLEKDKLKVSITSDMRKNLRRAWLQIVNGWRCTTYISLASIVIQKR